MGYAIHLIVAYDSVTNSVAQLALLGLVVAVAIGRGIFASIRPPPWRPEQRPRVWQAVRDIAAEVGVRAPNEIRTAADVNAAASEDSSWLGLRPGTRRLYLGAPLLTSLAVQQLRSVIAHELGHYSGPHTALAPVTYRGLRAIGRTVHHLDNGSGAGLLLSKVFGWYGRLYLRVSRSVARQQDFEADAYSAQVAGKMAAITALRELRVLAAAGGSSLTVSLSLVPGRDNAHRSRSQASTSCGPRQARSSRS